MRLVVDANVLVAESLRFRGLLLIAHPGLELFTTARIQNETSYELRRRLRIMIEQGRIVQDGAAELLAEAEKVLRESIQVVDDSDYADRLAEAGLRIHQDADDMPSAALALKLNCGIWTSDRDFFGCGLPVWATDVLRAHLEHAPGDSQEDRANGVA